MNEFGRELGHGEPSFPPPLLFLPRAREEGNRRRAKEPVTCHLLSLSLERLPVPSFLLPVLPFLSRAREKGKGEEEGRDQPQHWEKEKITVWMLRLSRLFLSRARRERNAEEEKIKQPSVRAPDVKKIYPEKHWCS